MRSASTFDASDFPARGGPLRRTRLALAAEASIEEPPGAARKRDDRHVKYLFDLHSKHIARLSQHQRSEDYEPCDRLQKCRRSRFEREPHLDKLKHVHAALAELIHYPVVDGPAARQGSRVQQTRCSANVELLDLCGVRQLPERHIQLSGIAWQHGCNVRDDVSRLTEG